MGVETFPTYLGSCLLPWFSLGSFFCNRLVLIALIWYTLWTFCNIIQGAFLITCQTCLGLMDFIFPDLESSIRLIERITIFCNYFYSNVYKSCTIKFSFHWSHLLSFPSFRETTIPSKPKLSTLKWTLLLLLSNSSSRKLKLWGRKSHVSENACERCRTAAALCSILKMSPACTTPAAASACLRPRRCKVRRAQVTLGRASPTFKKDPLVKLIPNVSLCLTIHVSKG